MVGTIYWNNTQEQVSEANYNFNLSSVKFEVTFILKWEIIYKSLECRRESWAWNKICKFSALGVNKEKTQYEDPKTKVEELEAFQLG